MHGDEAFAGRLHLRREYLNNGGYDRNGTYFGTGWPLYWVASDDETIDYMIRAKSREEAMQKVLANYPSAKFYGVKACPHASGRLYDVRFVHKISPRDADVLPEPVQIPDGAFSNRNTLARALRHVHVLGKGDSIREFRVEGDKIACFPRASIWHSIILTVQS